MYKLIIKLALKNSFSRLARTLLVVVMISVSMSMMLGIQGLYDGMALNMIDKNKRSDSGDISLFAKEYRIENDLKYSIKNAAVLKKQIKEIAGVEEVVSRLSSQGLVSTARKSSFSSIYGIDLNEEEKFGNFSEFLKKGEMTFSKRGAIVGIELAKTIKVGIGSKIIFSAQDKNGDLNSIALKVKGIVQTTNIALDTTAIYVDIEKLHGFLGTEKDVATQIAVKSDNKKLYGVLKTKYDYLDVKSFLELKPMIKQMEDMMLIFNTITFFIVMIVVFIGIFGVMYVSILDRIREFGIMLGIGMQYKYIRAQIFLESLIVGLAGYSLGACFGLLLLGYLQNEGLDLSAFSNALERWGYESTIYGTIKTTYFTTTFVAIISASLLSVLIPLRKIKKLNPIEVIEAEK